MKNNTQKAVSILAAALMITSLAGCSRIGESGGKNGGLEVSLENSYAGEQLTLENASNIYGGINLGGKVLLNGADSDYNDLWILYDPTDGSTKQVEFSYIKSLDENASAYPSTSFVDNDNHLNVFFDAYTWTTDENGDEQYEDLGRTLEVYDADFNVLETRSLKDVFGDDQRYFYTIVSNPAGGYYATTWDDSTGNQIVITFDKDFKETGKLQGDFQYIRDIYTTTKNEVYIGYDNNEGNSILGRIDETGSITPVDVQGIPSWYNEMFASYDDTYDLYLYDSTAVYGINFQKGVCEEVVNWINSDFLGNNISDVQQISDGRFLVSNYSMNRRGRDSSALWLLSPRDPDSFKNMDILSIAGTYLPDELGEAVLAFNRTHDNARIAMVDYSKYETEDDYEAGLKKLQTDMTSGIVADLIITASIPYESFANKGIFEDLTPYMADINDADYFMNFFQSMSYGDKLYNIGFSFDVTTVEGKSSLVGTKQGLTAAEYLELVKGLPEGTSAFSEDMSKQSSMYSLGVYNSTSFVDVKNKTCSFNSPDFIQLLEFCNTFRDAKENESMEVVTYDDKYWAERDFQYINDKVALNQTWISSIRDAYQQRISNFDDAQVTRIGFPTSTGNGGSFSAYNTVAMSANSKHKDICWEFMQYMLSDEYQENLSWSLPVSRKAFAKLTEEAMKPETYTDENGEEVEMPMTIWRGDESIEIPTMPQSFADELEAYIESITTCTYYDSQIYDIISEETEMYFSGDQTAEKAAEMIQSRVTLYLSEQS